MSENTENDELVNTLVAQAVNRLERAASLGADKRVQTALEALADDATPKVIVLPAEVTAQQKEE